MYQWTVTNRRHTSQGLVADLDRGRCRERITKVSDSVALLLIVWGYALGVGSRERGGHTRLQKGWGRRNLQTSLCRMYALVTAGSSR
jgi:hypothetical protein